MEKKTWVMPELIVLVRTNSEEAVLTNCKLDYAPNTGPATIAYLCGMDSGGCVHCDVYGTS